MYLCGYAFTNACMHAWLAGWLAGVGGWVDGRTDGRMDVLACIKYVNTHIYII